jgi:hypothetical protein
MSLPEDPLPMMAPSRKIDGAATAAVTIKVVLVFSIHISS